MRLQDVKIGTKLIGAFSILSFFFIIVGIMGLSGTSSLVEKTNTVKALKEIELEIESMKVAHLDWVKTAIFEILDPNTTRLSVTSNDHSCTLGQVIFGEKRKGLESIIPSTKQMIDQIIPPHRSFHETADKINALLAIGTPEARIKAEEICINETQREMKEVLHALERIEETIDAFSVKAMEEEESEHAGLNRNVIILITIMTLLAFSMGIFISRSITKPLHEGVELAQAIENGDLTQSLNFDRADEIGTLGGALDNMTSFLRELVNGVTETANGLNNSASNFNNISENLSNNSSNLTEKSSTVSSATEEINATMSSVSAAAEQSSTNINVVASSTEEMTTTVSEIAQNTGKAQQISSDAVRAVENALQNVNGLGTAANEVGNVVQVILEIADQTKLLALNATIEAARAGEAGKGFAVVANEVKELAAQTNSAIEEIRQKIDSIQSSSSSTISEISNIDKVINEVNEIVTSIATAVEEQSVTTKDIAANIVQAADGVKDMTQNISMAATATGMIAGDTAEVSQASTEVNTSSNLVSEEVKILNSMSEGLRNLISKLRM